MLIPAGWKLRLVDEDDMTWSELDLTGYDLAQALHRTGLIRLIEVAVHRTLNVLADEPPANP
jgi:hypothetical protein